MANVHQASVGEFIQINPDLDWTILAPANPANGNQFTVKDQQGTISRVTINGSGKTIFDPRFSPNPAAEIRVELNGGQITLTYDGRNDRWLTTYATTPASPPENPVEPPAVDEPIEPEASCCCPQFDDLQSPPTNIRARVSLDDGGSTGEIELICTESPAEGCLECEAESPMISGGACDGVEIDLVKITCPVDSALPSNLIGEIGHFENCWLLPLDPSDPGVPEKKTTPNAGCDDGLSANWPNAWTATTNSDEGFDCPCDNCQVTMTVYTQNGGATVARQVPVQRVRMPRPTINQTPADLPEEIQDWLKPEDQIKRDTSPYDSPGG